MTLSGHQNDVDSRIWDRFDYIRDEIVYYEAAINMNDREIKGLGDGNEDNDAVNVKQLLYQAHRDGNQSGAEKDNRLLF